MSVNGKQRDVEYQHLVPLFDQLADPALPAAEHSRVRDELVRGHLPIAEHIAQRYRNRGQSIEDLRQVARIGLIRAVDRYDPSKGADFISYAVPTIMGEVRRYFRDLTWMVSVPRGLKELNRTIANAVTELTTELGRSPRPQQIAAKLGISLEAVYDGLQAGMAYHADSLDEPVRADAGAEPDQLGETDPSLERVDNLETLRKALTHLSEREAAIVKMRFFDELTQSEIAARIGVSQVHVSRLLTRSIARLRHAFV